MYEYVNSHGEQENEISAGLIMVRCCNEDNWTITRNVECSSWSYFSEEYVYDDLPQE